jgi:hypothetical protein
MVCVGMLIAALTTLALAGSASAKLTGEYKKFEFCPYTNPEVNRCLYAPTTSGEVILGSKKVPIVNPAIVQGGYAKPVEGFSKFFAATNGVTLSKAAQPVPGGLAGFVNCKEISNFLLRLGCEAIFENGLTGVNSTLELAKPASEIRISEIHLAEEEEVALKLPVMVHLENPLFGESCYVGSESTPINWELTTGLTSPPEPNKPIHGTEGKVKFLEEGTILHLEGDSLVDNAWSAPSASGCGGIVSFIIDPIVNASAGLPSAAGHNTAILTGSGDEVKAEAVKFNNESNP